MYRKLILDNGVRLVTEQIPTVKSVTVGMWVNTGSRDESPDQAGYAHFIEHMFFKGTTTRSATDISREIDALGGEMGRAIDRTALQIRTLNESRGPAVQALRAQADKGLYSLAMKEALETQPGVELRQEAALNVALEAGGELPRVASVTTDFGNAYRCGAVVITAGTFLRGADGQRPVYGGTEKFQTDPHWRDLVLFYEYFHGDNGAGLGASHQTGWTGVVARTLHLFATNPPEAILAGKTRAGLQKPKPSIEVATHVAEPR